MKIHSIYFGLFVVPFSRWERTASIFLALLIPQIVRLSYAILHAVQACIAVVEMVPPPSNLLTCNVSRTKIKLRRSSAHFADYIRLVRPRRHLLNISDQLEHTFIVQHCLGYNKVARCRCSLLLNTRTFLLLPVREHFFVGGSLVVANLIIFIILVQQRLKFDFRLLLLLHHKFIQNLI